MPNKRWFETGYFASKPERVDRENGVIHGVAVCTKGEAKGHSVWLDDSFIDAVTSQGNAKKQGVKARFGHPNMCSTALGTFLGRFKNFRRDGDVSRADLFLSNEAKETPNGNLYDYILGMAENESDEFGTSIVFTMGEMYRKTESGKKVRRRYESPLDSAFQWIAENGDIHDQKADPVIDRDYAVCKELHACDAVDEPAANDGLFSRFAQETIAGQITEFFDLHPGIFDAVIDNPAVMAAIENYGDKIGEFFAKYQEYKTKKEPVIMAAESQIVETPETPEPVETPVVAEPETETEMSAETVETAEPAPTDDRSEFARMLSEFGAEIAAEVYAKGGGYSEAQTAFIAALKAENEELKKQKPAAVNGGKPAGRSEPANPRKKSIWK